MDQFRWTHRPLVVFAPHPQEERFLMQREYLTDVVEDLEERHVVLIEVTGSSPEDETLRHRFRIPATEFAVLLIGKDGGVKLQRSEPVTPTELFSLIDAMPMRRREMGERGDA